MWLFLIVIALKMQSSCSWITSYPYTLADFSICQREKPDVLMWVQGRATSPTHRTVIRQLMANKKVWPANMRIVTLFFVGISSVPGVQNLLEYEYEFYGDIVQNKYMEHYENQTAKMMSAMNFIADFCNNSKISIRIDDDVVFHPTTMIFTIINMINQDNKNTYNASEKYHETVTGDPFPATNGPTPEALQEIQEQHYSENKINTPVVIPRVNTKHIKLHNSRYSYYSKMKMDETSTLRQGLTKLKSSTVVCHILHHRISREHIYALDKKYLPNETMFPEYCAGFFIAFTTDLMSKFKYMFSLEPPFWIDDAYLGVLQKRLRTTNVQANQRMRFEPEKNKNIKTELTKLSKKSSIVIHLDQHHFYRTLGELDLLLHW